MKSCSLAKAVRQPVEDRTCPRGGSLTAPEPRDCVAGGSPRGAVANSGGEDSAGLRAPGPRALAPGRSAWRAGVRACGCGEPDSASRKRAPAASAASAASAGASSAPEVSAGRACGAETRWGGGRADLPGQPSRDAGPGSQARGSARSSLLLPAPLVGELPRPGLRPPGCSRGSGPGTRESGTLGGAPARVVSQAAATRIHSAQSWALEARGWPDCHRGRGEAGNGVSILVDPRQARRIAHSWQERASSPLGVSLVSSIWQNFRPSRESPCG